MEGVQVSPRILPALGLLGLLSGCEGQHLEGSVTALLDLHYDAVRAQADDKEVSVSFLTAQGSGENTVLKVAARLDDKVTLEPGKQIDLAELLGQTPESPQRGAVSRSVLDEPSRQFPRLLIGGLTLQSAPTPGASVSGDFHVTFVNGTDVYSGRTIFGRFEATVP